MSVHPFLTLPIIIQVHMIAALLALIIGAFVLFQKQRGRLHRVLGYLWVTAMAMLAISAFGIPSHFGPFRFGLLHGFAVVTLWSLWTGVQHARQRNFDAHQTVLRSLYSNGLIVAGAFTFLPGRTVNRMVFGVHQELGWLVIAVVCGIVACRVLAPRLLSARNA